MPRRHAVEQQLQRVARRRAAPGPATPCPRPGCPRPACPASRPAPGARSASSRGPLAHLRGEQQLAARRRPQPVDLVDGALVGDGEGADLLDLVAPELDPRRVLVGRREDVEDAAAHGELAALGDQVDPGVRHVGQPAGDSSRSAVAAGGQLHRLEVAEALELRLQHRRAPARRPPGPAGRRLGVGQPAQHGQPAPDRVRAGREPLVRQRLPGRVDRHLVRRQQAAQRGGEVVGLAAGGGDGEHRPAGAAGSVGGRDGGDHERAQRGRRGEVEPVGVGKPARASSRARARPGSRSAAVSRPASDMKTPLSARASPYPGGTGGASYASKRISTHRQPASRRGAF